MTIQRIWVNGFPGWGGAALTSEGGVHRVEFETEIPDYTRILKLVCSAGFNTIGASDRDLTSLLYPMTWNLQIVSEEISGIHRLNHQAGEFVTTHCVQPRWDIMAAGNTVPVGGRPYLVVTNRSAHIQPIDQSMSYGSVHTSMGVRNIFFRFDFIEVHGSNCNDAAPWDTFAGAAAIRILYEQDV